MPSRNRVESRDNKLRASQPVRLIVKTTQSTFACTVTGSLVTRIRIYEAVAGIGQPRAGFALLAERCSRELSCPFLSQCPMRQHHETV
jgi:hypothetical protein